MDIIGDDKEYCDEIERFINGNENTHYHCIYPRSLEDLSRQVPHSAPINKDGFKPVYIDMWTKSAISWGVDEIKNSVRTIAKDFLGMNIEHVEILGFPTYEETKLSYEQDYKPFVINNDSSAL